MLLKYIYFISKLYESLKFFFGSSVFIRGEKSQMWRHVAFEKNLEEKNQVLKSISKWLAPNLRKTAYFQGLFEILKGLEARYFKMSFGF